MIRIEPSINCRGKIINLDTPKIMGIVNVTPDSFYDGGKLNTTANILKLAEGLLSSGAHILDVGGASTRPGATATSPDEEKSRVIPAIQAIIKEFPEAIISVDTYRSSIANTAVNEGASIINDISGGDLDPGMFQTVAKLKVPYVLTHMRGTPSNKQENPAYTDVVQEVFFDLARKQEKLERLGLTDLIIDPGFGFGKTLEDNYKLIKGLDHFKNLGLPILVGISRKSMVYKLLDTTPDDALIGTTVLNTYAVHNGAAILRVHDADAARQVVQMMNFIHRV